MCLSFSDIYLSVQGMFVQEMCLSMFRGYIFVCSGDVFGVLVTYFGETCSTVIFLKNGYPVATRCLVSH